MSTELATQQSQAVEAYSTENDNLLKDFLSEATFYPRIKFCTNAAAIVKRRKFPENHFGLIKSKEEMLDLGDTFVGAPLAYRFTALDFSEKGKCTRHHDPNTEDFKRIKKESEKKRGQDEMNPYMCGIEFIMYVPEYGLVTLLCHNFSWRQQAGKLVGLCKAKRAAQFSHSLRDGGKFPYEGPDVSAYIGNIDVPDDLREKAEDFGRASGSFQEKDSTFTGEEVPAEATATDGRVR